MSAEKEMVKLSKWSSWWNE